MAYMYVHAGYVVCVTILVLAINSNQKHSYACVQEQHTKPI